MDMNFLSRLPTRMRAYLDPSQVGYLIFYVTSRCNFRCSFCFYAAEIEQGAKPDEMTVDEIARLAPSIGPLLQLSLTGGEPFLRADFAEITQILLDHTKAAYVTVPTNASLTDRMVAWLEAILPKNPHTYFRLCFSLEGTEAEHDEARSMPGSYAKLLASYKAIEPFRRRFHNFVLDCNAVFSAESENRLLGSLRFIDQSFEFDNISVTYARGSLKDDTLKQVSMQRYIEVNDFLESTARRKERRFLYPVLRGVRDVSRHVLMSTVFDDKFVLPCVAGRKLLVVSETGQVFPCEILGKAMGNLRDFDFDLKQLLDSSMSRELTTWISDTKCKCSFECALAANVVWNARAYPKLLISSLKNIGS